MMPVRNTAVCNRCGDGQVGWYKTKGGKWMLCTAYIVHDGNVGSGGVVVNRMAPHKCIVPPLPGYPKVRVK